MEEELEPAREWATRAGVGVEWQEETLELRVVLTQPKSDAKFYLLGRVESYKLLPPMWDFRDESWAGEANRRNFPSHGAPPRIGSIFHSNGVICAPFNRLAYKGYTGLHANWGDAQNWVHVAPGYVRADTIADMLATISLHFNYTTGRLG